MSFDRLHVSRVRATAIKLARTLALDESNKIDLLVVELAALFHDLHDSKYASRTADVWEDLEARFFRPWLLDGHITEERAQLVCKICENVSYSKEVKRIQAGAQTPWHDTCLELHCVQDADKLDAMGGQLLLLPHLVDGGLTLASRHRHHEVRSLLRRQEAASDAAGQSGRLNLALSRQALQAERYAQNGGRQSIR